MGKMFTISLIYMDNVGYFVMGRQYIIVAKTNNLQIFCCPDGSTVPVFNKNESKTKHFNQIYISSMDETKILLHFVMYVLVTDTIRGEQTIEIRVMIVIIYSIENKKSLER